MYLPGVDQSLYCFDLRYLEVRWRARFSGPLYEPPVLSKDTAYQYCSDDGLVAVNTEPIGASERIRWKLPRGRMLLTVDEENAFVLSRDETILVVRIADGELVQSLPATGFTLGTAKPDTTAVCVASADGRIFCARPQGAPLVKREDLRAALGAPVVADNETADAEVAAAAEQTPAEAAAPVPQGPPIGGKSKVSKNFGKSGATGSQP